MKSKNIIKRFKIKRVTREMQAFIDAMLLHPHLYQYMDKWDTEDGNTLPEWHEKLDRSMQDNKEPNLIYPAGGPIYIHIHPSPKGRSIYAPIEPELNEEIIGATSEIMQRITVLIDENFIPKDSIEHVKMFNHVLGRVASSSKNIFTRFFSDKLLLSSDVLEGVKYFFIRDRIGMGVMEPLIRDPYIEDISCSGLGAFFVEHKIFSSLEAPRISFVDPIELDKYVLRLSERSGRPASHLAPIVDSVLPDGSRINIVYGEDVSKKGSNFTIRKFSENPISITQIVNWNTMDSTLAAYLWMALESGMSIWVVGETASGKTTSLNAALTFVKPNAKIVSIEDTPEVRVPHANWVQEVTRPATAGAGVDIFDLLKAALRQRPNYIIVGEIRGKEGNIAFQAMQTGHPVCATFHAGSVKELINRLTGYPINIPPPFISLLDIVLIQLAVTTTKGTLRRAVSVNEMISYNNETEKFAYIPLFEWDAGTDKFSFRKSSHVLENKIGKARGYRRSQLRKLYKELTMRKYILESMTELGIFDYYEVFDVLTLFKTTGKLPGKIMDLLNEKIKNIGFD